MNSCDVENALWLLLTRRTVVQHVVHKRIASRAQHGTAPRTLKALVAPHRAATRSALDRCDVVVVVVEDAMNDGKRDKRRHGVEMMIGSSQVGRREQRQTAYDTRRRQFAAFGATARTYEATIA